MSQIVCKVKKIQSGFIINFEIPKEEAKRLREKLNRECVKSLAKELWANGMIRTDSYAHHSHPFVSYKCFIRYAHKPVQFPVEIPKP